MSFLRRLSLRGLGGVLPFLLERKNRRVYWSVAILLIFVWCGLGFSCRIFLGKGFTCRSF